MNFDRLKVLCINDINNILQVRREDYELGVDSMRKYCKMLIFSAFMTEMGFDFSFLLLINFVKYDGFM